MRGGGGVQHSTPQCDAQCQNIHDATGRARAMTAQVVTAALFDESC
jgi:hypothetical protein